MKFFSSSPSRRRDDEELEEMRGDAAYWRACAQRSGNPRDFRTAELIEADIRAELELRAAER